jgi:superfamily II RNA helicase
MREVAVTISGEMTCDYLMSSLLLSYNLTCILLTHTRYRSPEKYLIKRSASSYESNKSMRVGHKKVTVEDQLRCDYDWS